MNKLKFCTCLLIIFLLSFMLLAAVSAGNPNHKQDRSYPNHDDAIEQNQKAITPSEDMFQNNKSQLDPDTYVDCGFKTLQHDIDELSPGDVYNMNRDFYYDDGGQGIDIFVSNITINGNGHILDGKGKSTLFFVYGENVKISNLTFTNSYYANTRVNIGTSEFQNGRSPLCWEGNNGMLDSCIFYKNSALMMGGAITWKGNDGTISNCVFYNNTAGMIGGAIYLAGSNNIISRCAFLNSASKTGGENIFINSPHNSFISLVSTDKKLYTYNSIANLDIADLNYIYESSFTGEKMNLIPLIYTAMMSNESSVQLTSSISYYALQMGNTFMFTLSKRYDNGVIYQRNYQIYNVDNLYQVFQALVGENYKNDFTFIKTVDVNNYDDYEYARTLNTNSLITHEELAKVTADMNTARKDSYEKLMYQLEVNFKSPLTIDSDESWNPSDRGFDVINILGGGSTIKASSGDRDENNWVTIDEKCIFAASNICIRGFNNAVINLGGAAIFNNVTFDGNHMDYWIDRDWGAAILNGGECICINCTFTNNKCQDGGAIFNQATLNLNNCTFEGNKASSDGDNILNADKGCVYIDGEKIEGTKGVVEYIKSIPQGMVIFTSILGFTGSFIIGLIAGISTGNPIVGFSAGVAAGGFIGTICAATIIGNTYDMNYNRFKTFIILVAGCALAGGLGGAMGGFLAQSAAMAAAEDMVIDEVYNAEISEILTNSFEDVESASELSGSEIIEELLGSVDEVPV